MTKDISVLNIGTSVTFGEDGDIKGKITAVTIRETSTIYEITFWKADEIKAICLKESQFNVRKGYKTIKIGFENEI